MTRNPPDALEEMIRAMVDARVDARLAELGVTQPAEFLTVDESAALAKVSPSTVRRWIRTGQVAADRAGRIVRIRRADLDVFLRSGRRAVDADAGLSVEALVRRDFG